MSPFFVVSWAVSVCWLVGAGNYTGWAVLGVWLCSAVAFWVISLPEVSKNLKETVQLQTRREQLSRDYEQSARDHEQRMAELRARYSDPSDD